MHGLVKLTFFLLILSSAFCRGPDLVLVGGSGPHEGNIIVDGMPVCDDTFTSDSEYARPNMEVVCRMLGLEARNFTEGSKFGRVSDIFGIDSLKCKGDEMDLRDCPHETKEDCFGNEGAGVICYKKGLELRGGSGSHEGNIFLDGRPVCDDGFTASEKGPENALVVCRMLGFQSGTFTRESHFGRVPDDFIMDNVFCAGTENDIRDCQHNSNDNCNGNEAAGVTCSELKLLGGSGPHEGNIFLDGRPVCDDKHAEEEHGNQNAFVVCRMLGYPSGRSTNESHFGKVPNNFIMDEVQCDGTELDIRMCRHSESNDCDAGEGAGVICNTFDRSEGAGTFHGEGSGLSDEFIGITEDTNRATARSSSVVPPVCVCNGFKHIFNDQTTGECLESVRSCGKWCYVDLDSDCPDVRPSNNGAPYGWSCRACKNSSTAVRPRKFPTNQKDSGQEGESGGFGLGNTLAIVFFLLLVLTGIVLFWWCRRRQRRRRASRGRELAALELKESGEEYWPARRSTAASLAEYWPSATTRENLEVSYEGEGNELRESVDSNNYWVPSDSQYDKMG